MGWTFKTFKTYVDQRFMDQNKAVEAALRSAEKASDRADRATEKRFEGVNELRQMATDAQQTYAPKAEVKALSDKIDALDKRVENTRGRDSGFSIIWGVAVGAAAIVATLYLLFHK